MGTVQSHRIATRVWRARARVRSGSAAADVTRGRRLYRILDRPRDRRGARGGGVIIPIDDYVHSTAEMALGWPMPTMFAEDGRPLLVLTVLACGAAGRFLCNSAYCRGWWQTLTSALSVHCNRASFATRHRVEEFPCSDGEVGVVWWPHPPAHHSEVEDDDGEQRHLWVVLPGGMCNAAAGYVDDAVASGVFAGSDYCAFHNPGIESRVVNRVSPPGLTEVSYLEEFIASMKKRGYGEVSLIGFSAGSMLAMAFSRRADEIDAASRGAEVSTRAATLTKAVGTARSDRFVASIVGVNGPDKIRTVFEAHVSSWLRLDIYFSILLWTILRRAGVQDTVPSFGAFPWFGGWRYMVWITEECFGRPWNEMEDELWSCQAAMSTPLSTPTLRILSRNDPVIPYKVCDESLFPNLDRVLSLDEGGHCGVFLHYPELGNEVCEWSTTVRDQLKAEVRAQVGASGANHTRRTRARGRPVSGRSPSPGRK